MFESLVDIVVPLGFFASVIIIVYLAIQARSKLNQHAHDERMLAIEKGADIPISPDLPEKRKTRNPLAWPFAYIAIGLAMVLGNIIQGDFDLFWSLIPLFIGSALLIAHFVYIKQSRSILNDKKALDNKNTDNLL